MNIVIACIITSALTAKIVATYYFRKIDDYVTGICKETVDSNKRVLAVLDSVKKRLHIEE